MMDAAYWNQQAALACDAGDLAATVYAIRRSISVDPTDPVAHMALITNLDMLPYVTDGMKIDARLEFDRRFVRSSSTRVREYPNSPLKSRRLRVGYVSSDLFASSAAFCHGGLLLGADPSDVEVYVYSSRSPRARADDPVEPVFRRHIERYADVTALSDAQVAARIRGDRIDILVDLGGYSSGARMSVFFDRPAPIQITGWGHATGTHLSCFDYTVADEITVPRGDEWRYNEGVLRAPCIIMYVPTGPHGITYQSRSLRMDQRITFGYLGRPEKISQECLMAWAEILRRVPNSRLLLKSPAWEHEQRRAKVLVPMGACGIEPSRISFRGETHNERHMLTYNEVDVHLDSFWHSGGVTMMDAQWMGVPSVTLLGTTISGRVGASILQVLGQASSVTRAVDEYIAQACGLALAAESRERRLERRRAMERSVLVDQRAYAAAVALEYRRVWSEWCDTQSLGGQHG